MPLIWTYRAALVLAAYLAARVAAERPRHWPIAVALAANLVVDLLLAAVHLPRAASIALYLTIPALSAWATLSALDATHRPVLAIVFPCAGMWIFCGTCGASAKEAYVLFHLLSVAIQAVAILWWGCLGMLASVTERVLLVLLAGDLAAILTPILFGGPWELVQTMGILTALVASIVQALYLAGFRRGASPRATT